MVLVKIRLRWATFYGFCLPPGGVKIPEEWRNLALNVFRMVLVKMSCGLLQPRAALIQLAFQSKCMFVNTQNHLFDDSSRTNNYLHTPVRILCFLFPNVSFISHKQKSFLKFCGNKRLQNCYLNVLYIKITMAKQT